jgi:hypothetical protein
MKQSPARTLGQRFGDAFRTSYQESKDYYLAQPSVQEYRRFKRRVTIWGSLGALAGAASILVSGENLRHATEASEKWLDIAGIAVGATAVASAAILEKVRRSREREIRAETQETINQITDMAFSGLFDRTFEQHYPAPAASRPLPVERTMVRYPAGLYGAQAQ